HESIHYKHRDGSPFPAEECAVLKVLKEGKAAANREDVFIRKDGTFFDVLYSSSPIRESNETKGLVIVFQDITEIKAAQDAVIYAERRAVEEYQGLLERIVPLAETLGGSRELLTIYRALREFICISMDCAGFFVSFYDAEKGLRNPAYVWGEGEEIDVSKLPAMPITPGGGPNSQAI